MTYINILSFVLPLLVTSAANRPQNASSLPLNRTRRLSDGVFTEETLHLAKFMVSLRTRSSHSYYGENHFCGGVIIGPRFVLTSSHCCVSRRSRVPYPAHILLVVAGTPDRLKYQSGITFQSEVETVFLPDNFALRNEQDIGVLFIQDEFPRDNERIGIARLPYSPLPVDTMCTVTGWGRMYRKGPMSAKILQIDVRLINPEKCSEMLEIMKKDLLCALDENENTAQQPCGGDRGDPLMHGDTIYGIVSYLEACHEFLLPSVYTDVFQSINWIRRVIMDNGNVCHVSLLLFYGAVALNFLLTK